jgi:hypothetical protein
MGVFDIAGNRSGRWCAADAGDVSMQDVPYIKLVEYQQMTSALEQSLAYWNDFEVKANGEGSPYSKLYLAKATGNTYILPYFEAYHHRIDQTWSPGAGPSQDNNIGLKWYLIQKTFESPAAGVEQPHAWSGQALANYTVRFHLINTYAPDEDIMKNFLFLRTLTSKSLLGRPDAIRYIPPCLYTASVPGVRYSPACALGNFTVENVGSMNYHDLGGQRMIIPDAWFVTLNVKELILESREILNVAHLAAGEGTVEAIVAT